MRRARRQPHRRADVQHPLDPIGERLQSPYVKAATMAVVAVAVASRTLLVVLHPSHRRRAQAGRTVVARHPTAARRPQPQHRRRARGPPPPATRRRRRPRPSLRRRKPEPPKAAAAQPGKPNPARGRGEHRRPAARSSPLQGRMWVEIRDARGKLLFRAETRRAARPRSRASRRSTSSSAMRPKCSSSTTTGNSTSSRIPKSPSRVSPSSRYPPCLLHAAFRARSGSPIKSSAAPPPSWCSR